MRAGSRRVEALVLMAAVLSTIILGSLNISVPVAKAQSNPLPYDEVYNAYEQGINYINNLKRVVYDPNTWEVKYEVISEYPAISVWGRLNELTWVPGVTIDYRNLCDGSIATTKVEISLKEENLLANKSIWTYTYKFYLEIGPAPEGPQTYEIADVEVTEEQMGNGYYTVTVTATNYYVARPPTCQEVNGSELEVHINGAYAGTVGELMKAPWSSTYSLPLGSMRFSLRHVQVMGDLLLQASGNANDYLNQLVNDLFNVIFHEQTKPFDLYGASLFEYSVNMQIKPVEEIQFYDAHYFSNPHELGYDRMYSWMYNSGYVNASNPGTFYPLYPYKSKIVTVAEDTDINGGTLFLKALEDPQPYCSETDPLLNAWRGIYDAATGQWGLAVSEWYNIIDDWDGNGIKACYSEHYSTIRLAAAIMLGSLLAKHGYIGWGIVDNMVRALLKTQWSGSGYYKPSNGDWVYIYKNDHKGGFMVAYDVAPNGYFGVTGFRPDFIDKLLNVEAMKPEYVGVLPTNAETTLASLIALKLYMDARY